MLALLRSKSALLLAALNHLGRSCPRKILPGPWWRLVPPPLSSLAIPSSVTLRLILGVPGPHPVLRATAGQISTRAQSPACLAHRTQLPKIRNTFILHLMTDAHGCPQLQLAKPHIPALTRYEPKINRRRRPKRATVRHYVHPYPIKPRPGTKCHQALELSPEGSQLAE